MTRLAVTMAPSMHCDQTRSHTQRHTLYACSHAYRSRNTCICIWKHTAEVRTCWARSDARTDGRFTHSNTDSAVEHTSRPNRRLLIILTTGEGQILCCSLFKTSILTTHSSTRPESHRVSRDNRPQISGRRNEPGFKGTLRSLRMRMRVCPLT